MVKKYAKISGFIFICFLPYFQINGQSSVSLISNEKDLFRSTVLQFWEGLATKPGILEIGHGQAYTDWIDSWAWVFHTNYLFQLNNKMALGGGAGVQFDWTGLYPSVSVNSIFGKKSEGVAFGVDVRYIFTDVVDSQGERFWLSTGGYYRNFFVKVVPMFIAGYSGEWYVETGYSFDINF